MPTSRSFTVVFWNVLFDTRNPEVPAQHLRYKHIAKTLEQLNMPLDVVCLSEIEDSPSHGKHGEKIAELLGYEPGIWTYHAREREQIGVFGNQVKDTEFLMLDDGMAAAITQTGPITVAGVHLTHTIHRTAVRRQQIETVLEHLQGHDQAIIMGDFNSLPWHTPRRLVEAAGYRSVFKELYGFHPITSPIPEYQKLIISTWQRPVVGSGFSADDIYIKGPMNIIATGTLKSESDHKGVWATFTI